MYRSAWYDAGKKIKGKKRHLLVDTLGLLLHAIVHPADIQDRDGGTCHSVWDVSVLKKVANSAVHFIRWRDGAERRAGLLFGELAVAADRGRRARR